MFSLEYENIERSDRKMIDLHGRDGSPRRMLNDQWAFMQIEVRAAELRQHFEQHRMSALFAELAGLLLTGGREGGLAIRLGLHDGFYVTLATRNIEGLLRR